MADENPSPSKPPTDGPSELQGLDPGELLARGLHTVKPSGGAGGWEPPTPEEVGRLLPQYRIEKLIGRGGMGAVYKGIQLNLDRPVAIKLLPAEIAADTQFVTRFEREARTLAKLQHSRVVTIHDFGQTSEGHLYFVMEYIDGTDLRRILKGPGLDPEQALAVVSQLCDALQAAHREGIIHRDIKPENVLITRDGYVKLADFGLSRPPQEDGSPQLTNTNVVMGTPDYMAPEQRDGVAKADHRSDIFALGVMLYEMLTGQTPRGVFEPPSRKVRVDVRIDEVVLKALQSEPEYRYQKASELKTAVEHIRTTPPPKPATPREAVPLHKRTKMLIPAVAVSALLLSIAGHLLWPKKPAADLMPLPADQGNQGKTNQTVTMNAGSPVSTPIPAGNTAREAAPRVAPSTNVNPIVASKDAPFVNSLASQVPPSTEKRGPEPSEAEPVRVDLPKSAPPPPTRSTVAPPLSVAVASPSKRPSEDITAKPLLAPPPGTAGARADAVPWPPVPNKGGDPKNMERMICSFGWGMRNDGTLFFRPDHLLVLQQGRPPLRTGHWWSTGANMIHFQYSNEPADFDPNIGSDMTFNDNFTEFELCNSRSPNEYQQVGWRVYAESQSTAATAPSQLPAVTVVSNPVAQVQSQPQPKLTPNPSPATASQNGATEPARGSTSLEGTNAGERRVVAGIPFRWCPAGTFMMGSPYTEEGIGNDEKQHQVALTRGFWIGEAELTQTQWSAVQPVNPSDSKGGDLPVELVNWNEAMEWCRKKNGTMGLPAGWRLTLPTEAQWEYACRAGTTTVFSFGNSLSGQQANFDSNRPYGKAEESVPLKGTARVGSYPANAWGLNDMHGNVWEWCLDWYENYVSGPATDPQGPTEGSDKVNRGGAAGERGSNCRAATRSHDRPEIRLSHTGFRVALVPANASIAGVSSKPELPRLPVSATVGGGSPKSLEEALQSYNWSWTRIGDNDPPMVIQFCSGGRVSGGWHWQVMHKPNGQTIVDCYWGSDQHMFLSFNTQFSEFLVYNGAGALMVRGERLQPVGQPSTANPVASNHAEPSQQPATSVPPQNPSAPQPLAAVSPVPASSKIDELREHAASMVGIALAAPEQGASTSFEGYVIDLREDILDEAARKPAASQAAYNLGAQFCNTLLGVENERTAVITRLNNNRPSNAASGAAIKKVHPNWIDLEREAEDAARATHNNTIETPFHKQITAQWGMRAVELRNILDAEIVQFRTALRQSPTRK